METQALVLMVTVWTAVTFTTGFFFYKVLTTKPRPEPDSYLDNDDVQERSEDVIDD